MGQYIRHEDGTRVYIIEANLADGSLKSFRQKFSVELQHGIVERLIAEVEDGTLYLGDWTKGEIQIIGIQQIFANRFWTEVVYQVFFPPRQGNVPAAGTYRNIVWNSGVDAGAGALLLTENNEIVLVRSFRHAVRRWTLELPRGIRAQGEDFIACALREAREECGSVPTSGSQNTDLGIHDPDTGAMRQEAHVVAITNVRIDLSKVSRDVSESVLGPIVISIQGFLAMVKRGEITDGWATGAFTKALAHGLITL